MMKLIISLLTAALLTAGMAGSASVLATGPDDAACDNFVAKANLSIVFGESEPCDPHP